jgi:hypothetical protein
MDHRVPINRHFSENSGGRHNDRTGVMPNCRDENRRLPPHVSKTSTSASTATRADILKPTRFIISLGLEALGLLVKPQLSRQGFDISDKTTFAV